MGIHSPACVGGIARRDNRDRQGIPRERGGAQNSFSGIARQCFDHDRIAVGFHDILKYEHVGLDPSRVAAQVVSGIGFIGAGTIILQKQFVRGLTTAAGLWATAGIGLAIGGGLYWLGVAATVLTLVGLEFLRYVFKYIGIGLKVSKLIFTIDDIGKVKQILNDLNASGYHIVTYTLKEEKEDLIRVTMLVKSLESSNDENHLLMLIQKMPDVMLEKFE